MARNVYSKNIRRTIFGSLGRYIAIMAIIALGVGFFAGVKNTKGSMMETLDKYVQDQKMYDYRLISTYGFTEDDEEALQETDAVAEAEGSVTADFFSQDSDGNSIILEAHSITGNINLPKLEKGRMPEADNECVADSHFYSSKDLGKTIEITDENDAEGKDQFTYSSYKIVGIVNSPYYIMKEERGTTSLGDGRITAFVYMQRGAFTSEYYTEMLVTCKDQGFVFSDTYDKNIDAAKDSIENAAKERAGERYDEILSEAQEKIDSGQAELESGKAALAQKKSSTYDKLNETKDTLDSKSGEISAGKEQLKSKKTELTAQQTQLTGQIKMLQESIDAAESPESGVPAEQVEQMKSQLQQLQSGEARIESGLKEISAQEKKLSEGEEELKSGYLQYLSGKLKADSQFAEAEQELQDGEAELEDARKQLSEIEEPEIYVQTREDNIGYDSFESNSDIVNSVAKVFPVFFFLIAALVCSTTMTRMIDEERTQIGALRAMGYTKGRIMRKYMIYSGSAAMIGCIGGFLAGSKYFPYAIWIAYGMMFGFAPVEFYFSWPLAVISLAVSLICSLGTTWFACRGQLKGTPAEILRPEAPKAGKRIFLERIGFIWKHLKFLHKVTARNIFRYKKRMIMMIVGIGGCTALVLAGFGIYDSVAGIAEHQYTQIETYDMTAAFSKTLDEEEQEKIESRYGDQISNMAVLQQSSVDAQGEGVSKSCNLMISDDSRISKAVSFKDENGKSIVYPGEGEAVINNKLAEMLNLKKGDSFKVKYDDTKTVNLTVSGIYRNYVSNYIYINAETYEEDFGKTYEPSVAFLNTAKGTGVYELSESLNKFEDIMAISVNEDIKKRVDDMMISLNYIIILVIGCAGALAFIVLFNLGNINLTERAREIATIEVLGFYPREMGSYVFRENFILVLIGIAAGLPTGYILHKFIMSRIIVDAVSFNEIIEPISYGFAVLTVIGFSIIVDLILRRKMRKINMAEALKSIE